MLLFIIFGNELPLRDLLRYANDTSVILYGDDIVAFREIFKGFKNNRTMMLEKLVSFKQKLSGPS